MTIRFWRSGSPAFGLEVDDDEGARSWLSSGAAVGRFARELTPAESEAIDRKLATAARAPAAVSGADVTAPGETTEHLLADESIDLAYPSSAGPPAAYRDLVSTLRELLDDLVKSPVAAIVLDVAGPPYQGRLRHAGADPITVRMEDLTMTVTRFGPDDAVESTIDSPVDAAPYDGPLAPGWELPLPPAGAAAPEGGFVTITVGPAEVDVAGDGVLRRTEFGWTSE